MSDIEFGDSTVNSSVVELQELPSKFLPYPKGVSVFYRPYRYEELDSYNDSSLGLAESLRFIMDGVITRGMDKYDLTLSDFMYIALLRKVSSLGTVEFKVGYADALGISGSQVLTFDDIVYDELEIPVLPIRANLAGKEWVFNPLTVNQYLTLINLGDDKHLCERHLMAAQCASPFDESLTLINNLDGADLVTVKRIDEYLGHGIQPVVITFTHKDKEYRKTVSLDDPHALVWPFRGHTENADDPICFGLQADS